MHGDAPPGSVGAIDRCHQVVEIGQTGVCENDLVGAMRKHWNRPIASAGFGGFDRRAEQAHVRLDPTGPDRVDDGIT